MVNYMVAVDSSNFAKAAFFSAVSIMDKTSDHLFIITVVNDYSSWYRYGFGTSMEDMAPFIEAKDLAKNEGKKILRTYEALCRTHNVVNYHLILSLSEYSGEMICQAVQLKHIDFLFIGRRGLGKFTRWIVGSTSRYCVEHADCNVLVTKGEWGPDEEHSDIKTVSAQEEKERQERIKLEKQEEVMQLKEKQKVIGEEAARTAAFMGAVGETLPILEMQLGAEFLSLGEGSK